MLGRQLGREMQLDLKHSLVLQVWGEAVWPPHAALGSGAGERHQTNKAGSKCNPSGVFTSLSPMPNPRM